MKVVLALAAAALGAGGITVTTLPRPPFPSPVTAAPAAKHLVVVSSKAIAPGFRSVHECLLKVPAELRGLPFQRAVCPADTAFALYGRDGASARILLDARLRYAFDFQHYVWPPRIRPGEREFVYEEIVWAREANGVLYVENAHLTYAKSSYGQNAYITAIDLKTKRRLWRSRALVANADTFVLTPNYVVAGYGFTAEADWLYLLDRRTGRVVERLPLPTGPERITRKGNRLTVRTYDHVLVVDLRES